MRRILLLAGILGGVAPATAQTAPPSPRFQDSVTVTAALVAEEREDVSSSLDVLDHEEMDARQATEIVELLATLPGIAIVQSGSPGKVASLFSRGANSNHTLVLWNGVPLNDPFFGGFDWAHLETTGIDRVEVARGPYSALWGSDAVGGVVQVVTTRAPRGSAAGERRLRLEAGEDAYRRATLAASGRGTAWGLDLAGHSRRGDGVLPNDFYDRDGAQARLAWDPRPGRALGLLAQWQEAAVGLPRDFAGQPSPRRRQDQESRLLATPVSLVGDRWDFAGQLSWAATELALADPDDPFAASASEGERARGRAVATYRRDASWVAGGVEWQREEARSASPFGGLAPRAQRARAAFAQGSLALAEWRFDAGLRHDDHQAFGGTTTAKAGVVRRLGEAARLRASWGEGFHAPTLGDLYFPGFGNPELRPERSSSYEAGLELGPRPLRVAFVGFWSDVSDLIQFDFATFLPRNIGRARSRGLEVAADWRGASASARLAATYLDAEDRTTGRPLPRRPRESASLFATWRPATWGLYGVLRYVGARRDVGEVRLASYAVAELGLTWEARPWIQPYARVENLADESYEEAAGFPAPGRGWIAGAALRF